MRLLLAAALAVLALLPAPASAWGDYAHRQTARVAQANVSPEARAKIRALLAREKDLGTPKCPLRTLEDASVWADCVRGEGWRWGYTAAWHYRTAPICEAFNPRANCSGGNCVTAQIARAHAFAVMAARIARRLHLIKFAIAQASKPGDAAKGAEIRDIFRHQPAREGFIIRQAPIRRRISRGRLMRGLHQHQRMTQPGLHARHPVRQRIADQQ